MNFYMMQAAKKEDSSSLTENRNVDNSDSDSDRDSEEDEEENHAGWL